MYKTYREYLVSVEFAHIRRQAKQRSGGVCEMCRAKKSTEVHHLRYPPWGTFEINANGLVDVCHVCHCLVHGKEN